MTVWAGRIWDCRGAQALPLSVQRPEAVRPELSSKAPLERLQLVARPNVVCNLSSNATILGQEPLSFSQHRMLPWVLQNMLYKHRLNKGQQMDFEVCGVPQLLIDILLDILRLRPVLNPVQVTAERPCASNVDGVVRPS